MNFIKKNIIGFLLGALLFSSVSYFINIRYGCKCNDIDYGYIEGLVSRLNDEKIAIQPYSIHIDEKTKLGKGATLSFTNSPVYKGNFIVQFEDSNKINYGR